MQVKPALRANGQQDCWSDTLESLTAIWVGLLSHESHTKSYMIDNQPAMQCKKVQIYKSAM